jgi:hypothetical protein
MRNPPYGFPESSPSARLALHLLLNVDDAYKLVAELVSEIELEGIYPGFTLQGGGKVLPVIVEEVLVARVEVVVEIHVRQGRHLPRPRPAMNAVTTVVAASRSMPA